MEEAPSTPPPTTADNAIVQQTTFQVIDFIDAKQLRRDLGFSPRDLDTAQMEQASLFAHYGELAAKASHQTDVAELLLESTEAAVYKLLRDKAVADKEKVTEAQLEKLVARHTRVVAMKKALNEAKRVEAMGKVAMEGFRQRRDMLMQQGATQREERKGELVTMARSAAADAQELQRAAVLQRIQNKHNAAAE